jgi:DNA ligase-1
MRYNKLSRLYAELEKLSSRIEMTSLLRKFLSEVEPRLLPEVTLLLLGRIFPRWSQLEIGVASQLMLKAIARASGLREGRFGRSWGSSLN